MGVQTAKRLARFFRILFTVVLSAASGFLALSLFPGVAYPFPVEVTQAPEGSLSLIVRAIQSAKTHIAINVYQLSSAPVTQELIAALDRGVRVEVLQEGQTVEGLGATELGVQERLGSKMVQAKNQSRLLVMVGQGSLKRRFRYNHAKYLVVDGESVLVGSENFTQSGLPLGGKVGNRGWLSWLHSKKIASRFLRTFREDADPGSHDIRDVTEKVHKADKLPVQNDSSVLPISIPMREAASSIQTDAKEVSVVASPESSQSMIIKLIQSAKTSLDIQQMTFDSDFGRKGESPIFLAVLDAARSGVRVRVLVNPDFRESKTNSDTVRALNQLAKTEGLKVEARIANLKAMKVSIIHNKGVIVDEKQTLISSINWTMTSVTKNREMGVILESRQVARFFSKRFESDWNHSERL